MASHHLPISEFSHCWSLATITVRSRCVASNASNAVDCIWRNYNYLSMCGRQIELRDWTLDVRQVENYLRCGIEFNN